MNTVTTVEPLSAAVAEHVLGTGDLSKLTAPQRVEYYNMVCKSLDLNPFTRPFRFLSFNGQIQLYATKDCTDQLRTKRKVNLHITDKAEVNDLYIVTVRARMPDGREDEDMGAVTIGKTYGEGRANAIMKSMTKAKRRVTLSICGLGMPDESELDGMPGAFTFDADQEPPAPKAKPPAQVAYNPVPAQTGESGLTEAPEAEAGDWLGKYTAALSKGPGGPPGASERWLVTYEDACATASSKSDLVRLHNLDAIGRVASRGPEPVKKRMHAASSTAFARLEPKPTVQSAMDLGTEQSWNDEAAEVTAGAG